MSKLGVAVGCVAVGVLSGCVGEPEAAVGTSAAALLTGAHSVVFVENRQIVLYVPPSYDEHEPLPLVLVLHGFGQDAQSMIKSTKMSDKAKDEGFVVAYLNGTKCDPSYGDPGCVAGEEGQGWNNGLSPSLGITVDDVQFVRDVVERVGSEVRIDERRIFAAGFSNGAFMTHRLAAELPDLLAGVALAAGTVGIDRDGDGTYFTIPDPIGATPILMMHGTDDTRVRYDGSAGGLCPCYSLSDSVEFWVEHNRCRGPASTEAALGVTTTSYGGCHANSDVVSITIDGGGHEWPSIGTDATWSFFSKLALTAH